MSDAEIKIKSDLGYNGVYNDYAIAYPGDNVFGHIRFQDGPKDGIGGVNGCQDEDVLAILIHRLKYFGYGELACREYSCALTKLEEAAHWLNARNAERRKRGVDGTNEA